MSKDICIACGRSRFSTGKGHGRYCNGCYSKIRIEQVKKNPITHAKEKAKSKHYIQNHPHRSWAIATINSHKARGHQVELTTDELETLARETTNCFYCDKKLKFVRYSGHSMASPSLDRLDNGLNICRENIAICCRQCNSSKLNRTLNEFIEYCRMIVDKFTEK